MSVRKKRERGERERDGSERTREKIARETGCEIEKIRRETGKRDSEDTGLGERESEDTGVGEKYIYIEREGQRQRDRDESV